MGLPRKIAVLSGPRSRLGTDGTAGTAGTAGADDATGAGSAVSVVVEAWMQTENSTSQFRVVSRLSLGLWGRS